MEYDYEDQRIGAGIITLSVLHFIASALSILGAIIILVAGTSPELKSQFESLNINLSSGSVIFEDIILRLVLIVSLILILKKNKIGIYGYYLFTLISLVLLIVNAGFNIFSIVISLIFPILMGIFISKKKNLFGF